jgi:hypothetical protein
MKQVYTVLLLVLLSIAAFGQDAQVARGGHPSQTVLPVSPQHQAILRAIYQDMNTRVPPPPTGESPTTATFVVTYNGFTPQAQAAFQYAVNIWSSLLVSSVPIRVTATWTPLNPGILGSAGASSFYRDFPNAPQPGTWYAVALAEKLAGVDLNVTTDADIDANFSSAVSNWYYGTDGNTPPGQFDLVTVVLHELCHGLTFAGSMTVSGGLGSWGISSGFPFTYDRFGQNGAGQSLINTTLFPNPSTALAAQLQSNSVFFSGPQAIMANGGTRPPLYAPASWIQGSSYSHLNESTYPAGNANSLMTPEIGMAEAIHNPGAVTLGMFRDMGWTTGGGGGSNIKFEERFVSTTIPPGWRVVDNDGGGTPLAFRQMLVFTSGDTVRPQAGASFWHGSFNGANGSGRIDEWLIGPRIRGIVSGDSLYFYAGAIGGQYHDSLRVFISTTDSSLSSFTNQIGYFNVAGPTGSWHLYGFSLSSFAGSDVFVAVNYFIVNGGPAGNHSDNVWIDHFMVTTDFPVSVSEQRLGTIPSVAGLSQNYPNPFNPTTRIGFRIAGPGFTTLRVYDVLGREVRTLVSRILPAGNHEVTFDAGGLASGTYYYRLTTSDFVQTRKLLLLR